MEGIAQPMQPLKIAIIGTAPTCWDAPYDDESWTIWSLSGCFELRKRYDAWFEIHSNQAIADSPENYRVFLKEAGEKLIISENNPEYPLAKLYPKDDMFKLYPRKYFTSTIAWMLALAISLNPDEIGLWGVDMVGIENEYHRQRPCCEYYVGLAEGKGIKVTIPKNSALMKGGIYSDELMNDINNRLKAGMTAQEKHRDDLSYQKGANDILKDLQLRWA